ncbi:MAG: hypothetical protein JSU63_03770 [Phycisphaerales bacterium]|nr:MAG: hypothetical protein JSU63_03770 [Phycisphaerales bacterium]
MNEHKRMSPLTALFLGAFGVGAIGITCATGVVLFSLSMVDGHASTILGFATDTVEGLPELLRALPPGVNDVLSQRRAPGYASQIDVKATLVENGRAGTVRPVLTVTNSGDEAVSILALRVAVLNEDGIPVGEWTEVVATPLAIDGPWRGPILPGSSRHVVLRGAWRGLTSGYDSLTPEVEIADVFVWTPTDEYITTASLN